MESRFLMENRRERKKRVSKKLGLVFCILAVLFTLEAWLLLSDSLQISTVTGTRNMFFLEQNFIQSENTSDRRAIGNRGDISSTDRRRKNEEKPRGEEEEEQLPLKEYTFPNCDCVRLGVNIELLHQQETQRSRSGQTRDDEWLRHWFNLSGPSTCSDFATQRGGGQRVVAYSYYNNNATTSKASTNYKKYLAPLHKRAQRIAEVYPGYLMRIYHNVKAEDTTAVTSLCTLLCTHSHVDLCDVTNLPGLGNLVQRGVVGRAWRFAVLGDPTVDLFLSRDSDSWVLDREVDAVHEWLASGRAFHVMRDHPTHRVVMLAGLWGGRNIRQEGLAKIRDTMFDQPMSRNKNHDQHLLANLLWPVIQNDTLQHDSFPCQEPTHLGAIPFPTKRVEDFYCGSGPFKIAERARVARTICPEVCRPPKHPSWTRC